MLGLDMEYRKVVLFIRLSGELNHNTASRLENEVSKLIAEVGIKYIVFNIENLTLIDMAGIDVLLKNNDIVCHNQGKAFVCGIKHELVKHRIENSRLLKYMVETSNELGALNIINI